MKSELAKFYESIKSLEICNSLRCSNKSNCVGTKTNMKMMTKFYEANPESKFKQFKFFAQYNDLKYICTKTNVVKTKKYLQVFQNKAILVSSATFKKQMKHFQSPPFKKRVQLYSV